MLADTILIIDDEPQIRRVVKSALADEVSSVFEASGGAQGIAVAAAKRPTLVVLDLGLPDMAGIDVCRSLRSRSSAPIVVLSARHSDREKALLLDSGADDYITKPFSTIEFAARIRANLRRVQAAQLAAQGQPLTIGSLVADFTARLLRRGSETLHLTPIEWELLRAFTTQAGRTLTHQQIFNAVWGRSFGDPQQYLRVHVANLRRKIETDPVRPQLIVTEPGVGYRFEMPR
jgi:two-component system, OmpR family, KDP operon response regulator KdpE